MPAALLAVRALLFRTIGRVGLPQIGGDVHLLGLAGAVEVDLHFVAVIALDEEVEDAGSFC